MLENVIRPLAGLLTALPVTGSEEPRCGLHYMQH